MSGSADQARKDLAKNMALPKPLQKDMRPQYGNPKHRFDAIRKMVQEFNDYFLNHCAHGCVLDDAEGNAVNHAVYMIVDKLTRIAKDPKDVDHWNDVAGYAHTAKMALGLGDDGGEGR